MEDSIESIKTVTLYLILEQDFAQVHRINDSGRERFDAWEMEAYQAYSLFKIGECEQAQSVLQNSSYRSQNEIRGLFDCLSKVLQKKTIKVEHLEISKYILRLLNIRKPRQSDNSC